MIVKAEKPRTVSPKIVKKAKAKHPYIVHVRNIQGGEPTVRGSRIPVRVIVGVWRMGYSPEEIQAVHYPSLTLAEVFDALGYFSDNQQEILRYIELNHIPDELIDLSVRYI